jgi:3-hydroxyisobutyrate dehydrogenase
MRQQAVDRTVGVVGLGSMGGAMARALLSAGWTVLGHDPTPAARERAAVAGVQVLPAATELAGTPVLVLSLPSAAVVRETVPALLSRPGTSVIVDTTTSEPATSQAMAALAAASDVHFLDAPVSGGQRKAATGTLSAFVGGAPDAVAAAEAILGSLTSGHYTVAGPSGAGNVVKLLNNVLCATHLVALGEAADIAAAYGLDLETVVAAISGGSGGSAVSANAFPEWILSGSFDSGFSLGLMARDVQLTLDVARLRGVNPELLAGTDRAWQQALAKLGPQADFSEAPGTVTTVTTELSR